MLSVPVDCEFGTLSVPITVDFDCGTVLVPLDCDCDTYSVPVDCDSDTYSVPVDCDCDTYSVPVDGDVRSSFSCKGWLRCTGGAHCDVAADVADCSDSDSAAERAHSDDDVADRNAIVDSRNDDATADAAASDE